MQKTIKFEEIINLLDKGFSPQLISFELDLPIEYVNSCKKHLDQIKLQSKSEKSLSPIIDKKTKSAHLKMQRMKKKYRMLSSGDTEKVDFIATSSEENAKINQAISLVEQKLNDFINASPQKRISLSSTLAKELKNLEELDLDIEQAKRLSELLSSNQLEYSSIYGKSINKNLFQARTLLQRNLAIAISNKIESTDNLDDLNSLKSFISSLNSDHILISQVKSKVNNKILKIQQQNLTSSIYDSLPNNIIKIVKSLANDSFDYETSVKVVEGEAENKLRSAPKTKILATKDKQIKQIFMQINHLLERNAEEFPVLNPESTISNLIKLEGDDSQFAVIRSVVKNLLERKEFSTAKQLCDNYISINRKSSSYQHFKILKKDVASAEIADFILHYLTTDTSPEEELIFLENLDKKLTSNNIKLSSIHLGKSKDNLHTITLEEIYTGTSHPTER